MRLARYRFFLLVGLVAALSLAVLFLPKLIKRPPYEPWPLRRLPLMKETEGLEAAISASLSYLQRLPPGRTFSSPIGPVSREQLLKTLNILAQASGLTPQEREVFLEKNLQAYHLRGDLLVTGYYEPLIKGDRRPSDLFSFPIYRCPDDLITVDLKAFGLKGKIFGRLQGRYLVPYYSREEIDIKGVLSARGLELFWLSDPLEAYFLQVQGSGVIELPGGERVRVHFACSNGRPYVSLAQILPASLNIKSLEEMKRYLRSLSDPLTVLAQNPRYVFFEEVSRGPLGSLGKVLVPERSVALDPRIFPPAAAFFLITRLPIVDEGDQLKGHRAFEFLVFNHDQGAAIKGPTRLDLFLGTGKMAGQIAGRLKAKGELFFLLAKEKVETKEER